MFADFNKAFFNENPTDSRIPKEVLESLNDNLPDGFVYTELDSGMLGLSPIGSETKSIGFSLDNQNEVFVDFKPSNEKELSEYLYRTQKTYEMELNEEQDFMMNGVRFKLNEMITHPFKEDMKGKHIIRIVPQPFPKPISICLETSKIKKDFLFQRQPLGDMNKSLFKSINNETFEISFIVDEQDLSMTLNYKVNIESHNTVDETIEALNFYLGFITGEFIFDGNKVSNVKLNSSEEESVKETIKFWTKVLELQDVLRVKFHPKLQIETEEIMVIEQLYRTIIKKRPFKKYININEFTLTGTKEMDLKDLPQKKGISFSFQNTSNIEILGIEVELYSIEAYFDFIVNSIESVTNDDPNTQQYILEIKPIEGKKMYQSILYFDSEKGMSSHEMNLAELQKADIIEL